MPERDNYAPGTPSWTDLGSPDPDASARFYSALFGWHVTEPSGPETGNYRMCELNGKPVAGLASQQAEGVPPWWTTYVTVADVDDTTKVVEEAGGTVLMPAMDVMTAGRMAIYADPTGATFSVWQPGDHHGAGLVNEPGTVTWNELMTRDLDTAKRFYSKVFGWQPEDVDMGGGSMYTLWKMPGAEMGVGGAMAMNDEEFPAEVPNHWMVYFSVADCDASAAKVQELGGSIMHPPTDIPNVGRFAICNSPTGEALAIIANPAPDEGERPS